MPGRNTISNGGKMIASEGRIGGIEMSAEGIVILILLGFIIGLVAGFKLGRTVIVTLR
jgi:hypothetical protein